MVAAGMAGSDMWRTGLVGMQLAAPAYLMPFLWAYNPAILLDGTPVAVAYAIVSIIIAGWMLALALPTFLGDAKEKLLATFLLVGTAFIGGSTVWFGQESPIVLIVSIVGFGLLLFLRARSKTLDTNQVYDI
jgi:TRAP-type uncharacterized transport system fused permease subunit